MHICRAKTEGKHPHACSAALPACAGHSLQSKPPQRMLQKLVVRSVLCGLCNLTVLVAGCYAQVLRMRSRALRCMLCAIESQNATEKQDAAPARAQGPAARSPAPGAAPHPPCPCRRSAGAPRCCESRAACEPPCGHPMAEVHAAASALCIAYGVLGFTSASCKPTRGHPVAEVHAAQRARSVQ